MDWVLRAATDRTGDLLRLELRDDASVGSVVEALSALGFASDRDDAAGAERRTWYDARTVGELSFIEAGVIAERIVTTFGRSHPLLADEGPLLRTAIAEALHACFITTPLGAGPSSAAFHDACRAATVAASTPLVGEAAARELGRLLDADMHR